MKYSSLFTCALLLCAHALHAAPVRVQVVAKDGRFALQRDGAPYFIKGAGGGGVQALEGLARDGANSIRLWGGDDLGAVLDRAQKLGLTVTVGLGLGKVRQGFDWQNAAALEKQRERVRAVVAQFKGHPALLCWALGNEMEDQEGKNTAVWTQINVLARMVKELDPAHPTMTVIAEIGGVKVPNFQALCPDVDILGINSYGGAATLAERYRKAGGTKPFILTEYGPQGIWEIKKGEIGAYPELTSTAKADLYRRTYRSTILGSDGLCLGGYAFCWGQKQEVTATWFSMFLSDGTRLGAAEAVAELWTGKAPANRVPVIKSLTLNCAPRGQPGTTGLAALEASDPEGEPLKITWSLQRDPGDYGTGGDQEAVPPTFPDAIVKTEQQTATIVFPKEGGLYRLFATVRDDHGGGAVANVALRVAGPEVVAKGQHTALPLTVYAEKNDPSTFTPSGFMGDTKAIKVNPAWPRQPHAGSSCLRCDFEASKGWGGVIWQHPAGDWGDRGGGYDLTDAKKLTFWARGEKGGETVSFEFGMLARPKKYFDTGKGQLEKVVLTREWRRYEIAAGAQDLTRIKTGFGWSLASPGQPVTFYLDDIRWE